MDHAIVLVGPCGKPEESANGRFDFLSGFPSLHSGDLMKPEAELISSCGQVLSPEVENLSPVVRSPGTPSLGSGMGGLHSVSDILPITPGHLSDEGPSFVLHL